MFVSILIAIIGGVGGIGGAVISTLYAQRLARIQGILDDEHDANKARRDYEYEARKRLYSVYEPIKFQQVDLIEQALRRISMLSLAPPVADSIDEAACVYEILAPAALFRMMGRNLTIADMQLEPQISAEYGLIKASYRVLADASSIASIYARVSGGIDMVDPGDGLPPHLLDDAADSLLRIASADGNESSATGSQVGLITLGQLREIMSEPGDSRGRDGLDAVTRLLSGFSPQKKPVFWRCLVTQAFLYGCYLDLVLGVPDPQGDRLRGLGPLLLRQVKHALDAGIRLDKNWMSGERPLQPELDATAVRDALPCAANYYKIRVLPAMALDRLALEADADDD
jgi:hypothetical protein